MKFSIIIPLYNKAPYIRKVLESVLAQTYHDYELIIVDDGSTDDSARIAEEYIREVKDYGLKVKGEENSEAEINTYHLSPINYKLKPHHLSSINYKLIRQTNSGVSAARNNGVAQASGEYIAFLDADDWWEPTYLERMVQLIEDYPEAGLYACNYIYYKPGKTHVAIKNIKTGYFNYPKAYYESNAMPVTSITAIIPQKVYNEMGGFPLGIKLGEDFLLWAKTAMHYPVAFCDEPLAYYNNDVPVNLRATRNLHHPNNHMLFRMEVIGCSLKFKGTGDQCKVESGKCKGTENSKADDHASTPYTLHLTPSEADWQRLIDKLRVNGLLEYWLDKRYHDLAAEELKKVDWSKQPDSLKRMYKTPIWFLKLKRQVMKWGSWCKQLIIRLKVRG